jgi:CDP-diacylglycerol--serine O-phosphatidyltransferase
MKKQIPNFITLLNLTSGSLGIIFILNDKLLWAAGMIFLASLFDFLDGFSARMLNAWSEVGKSLDSLADMISFGLLPGILIYSLQVHITKDLTGLFDFVAYSGLLIPAFSGIRLAIFNTDEDQKNSFKGLPTPANALFFASVCFLIINKNLQMKPEIVSIVILALTILMSVLLVSKMRMFALKFKSFSLRENLFSYLQLLLSILALIFLGIPGIAVAIMVYIVLSITTNH